MTPAAKGRFCESCNKQVVDFSLMTDHEVLNYFTKNTGKVCGRFANDQLERSFTEAKQPKQKSWWIAMLMPLLLLVNKVNAQKKNFINNKAAIIKKSSKEVPVLLGDIATKSIEPLIDSELSNNISINGRVVNEKGEAVPYATVHEKDFVAGTAADSAGYFELQTKSVSNNTIIEASAIGYKSNEIKMDEEENNVTIVLKQKEISLPEIIVIAGNYTTGRLITMGGIGYSCEVRRRDNLDTAVRKIFKTEFFKVYPNPIAKGSIAHIEIKKAGEYSIQLFDDNSKLILIENFTAANDKAVANLHIPSALASGMYYIRVIDEKKKKQYADKILVQ